MRQAGHLTEEELSKYQRRTLVPVELLEVDEHIAECDDCRARLWQGQAAISVIADLRNQLSEHLDYDQIVACAEGRGGPNLEVHLAECELCQTEVDDLRQFRTDLSATPRTATVIAMPVRKKPSRFPTYAAIAAGAVLVAGLTFWSLRKQPPAPPVQIAQQNPPAEPALSPEQQSAVQLALSAHKLERAPVLDRLIARRGVLLGAAGEARTFEISAPMGTTVLTDRPTFKWQAVSGASKYVVAVFDENFQKIAESPALTVAEWQPEQPMSRGSVYNWQVTATVGGATMRSPLPPAPEARFQIAGAADAVKIEAARRDHPDNHLLLAVLLANAGALDDASRELDALAATDAPTAQALRDSLAEIRKK